MVVPLDTVTAAMKLKKNGSMEAETGLPPLLVTSWKFEVPAVPVKLLERDGGEGGIGAVVGICRGENAVKGIADAGEVVEVAEIGVDWRRRRGVALGGQRNGAAGGEVVVGRQQLLR